MPADYLFVQHLVEYNKDSIDLIKVFLSAGIQVRHVKNMPPMNFGVSDKGLAATIEKMEGGRMSRPSLDGRKGNSKIVSS